MSMIFQWYDINMIVLQYRRIYWEFHMIVYEQTWTYTYNWYVLYHVPCPIKQMLGHRYFQYVEYSTDKWISIRIFATDY